MARPAEDTNTYILKKDLKIIFLVLNLIKNYDRQRVRSPSGGINEGTDNNPVNLQRTWIEVYMNYQQNVLFILKTGHCEQHYIDWIMECVRRLLLLYRVRIKPKKTHKKTHKKTTKKQFYYAILNSSNLSLISWGA